MVRQLLLAGLLGAILTGTSVAVTSEGESAPGCDEGTYYGTVIVLDEDQGLFSLVGSGLELVASPYVDLAEIEGRAVRIYVEADCSVRDIEILNSASDAVT